MTTFSVGNTTQVSGVTASVDAGPAQPLPVTVDGSHQVVIGVGFTGDSGGFAVIHITGRDDDRIDQVQGIPFRNRAYAT